MALKQCNFKQAIDVIDKNFRNSLDKQKLKKEHSHSKDKLSTNPAQALSRQRQKHSTIKVDTGVNIHIRKALEYKHFISGTMNYEQFSGKCRKRKLTIAKALDVIFKDVNSNRDENYINSVVFGVEELNNFLALDQHKRKTYIVLYVWTLK
ncbi:hypothetical protein GLOIN_2v1487326 [Rhizophagus irregularis DAOM 181602=DAOM 197198]|uniref:Uncharacterized protein n=1 Tax=Rhizophagus irregularis (strain DAOM 181602 / DAOM 197198 / MUCL 43194) TaxID=747089 RepID=U9V5E7_RHIID|nr:hypothetical protein GLOIN_2v1487326 [Rhizophagus irregularis DAOM 181602=DAOM 197198]POG60075.1 hypothetical protein GLOIN_2v1487326 [Rhizophagus irregularis DAOM 181602=DAOM 197198]GBC13233.1 hypothetical protein GLOIN_2v1487326 [Rhizophagus irregularis DAOM 181602=DAOM 197198]|eukprot:XP_025166941.1 hypothetical protein GLOIN_2v1487326 [Rhizophagus irregularis DAOM 181602=DAOM 197198]